jgi:hypothetical protein
MKRLTPEVCDLIGFLVVLGCLLVFVAALSQLS